MRTDRVFLVLSDVMRPGSPCWNVGKEITTDNRITDAIGECVEFYRIADDNRLPCTCGYLVVEPADSTSSGTGSFRTYTVARDGEPYGITGVHVEHLFGKNAALIASLLTGEPANV